MSSLGRVQQRIDPGFGDGSYDSDKSTSNAQSTESRVQQRTLGVQFRFPCGSPITTCDQSACFGYGGYRSNSLVATNEYCPKNQADAEAELTGNLLFIRQRHMEPYTYFTQTRQDSCSSTLRGRRYELYRGGRQGTTGKIHKNGLQSQATLISTSRDIRISLVAMRRDVPRGRLSTRDVLR